MSDILTPTQTKDWRFNESSLGIIQQEPLWALELRKDALETFLALPIPKSYDEPWRRTNVSHLNWGEYSPFWDAFGKGESVETLIPHDGFQRIHVGQGTQQPNRNLFLSSYDRTKTIEGLVVLPMGEAIHRLPDSLKPMLELTYPQSLEPSLYKLIASVFAFRNSGAFIRISKGVRCTLPVGVVNTLFTNHSALYTHNIVIVEDGAELTISEEFISPNDDRNMLSLSLTKFIVGENAKLHFTGLQNWGLGVNHFGIHQFVLERNAQLDMVWGGIGGKLVKSRIIVELAGEGASAKVGGFLAGGKRQHLDHHTTQHHLSPNTTSDLLFKGVVNERARSVYQGLIIMDRIAQQSDAYQSVKHLTLSPKARVDALPGLEILADNVRCTHGATTRPVNEDEIYYMSCRGLSKKDSEELLIEAHIEPILARIQNMELQERCREAVTLKLVGHTFQQLHS